MAAYRLTRLRETFDGYHMVEIEAPEDNDAGVDGVRAGVGRRRGG